MNLFLLCLLKYSITKSTTFDENFDNENSTICSVIL